MKFRNTIVISVLILLTNISICNAQQYTMQKANISPNMLKSIGGISLYNGKLYILLPANISYDKKIIEASESKTIAQKYAVWQIYHWDYKNETLTNMSEQWQTKNASPNGFAIVNDSTVVYVDSKMKLQSNQGHFYNTIKSLSKNKNNFADPYWDQKNKHLYFSADIDGGKGGMDIWYIDINNQKTPINLSDVNSPHHEMSPAITANNNIVFTSNKQNKQYNIFVFNTKTQTLIFSEKTQTSELFTNSERNDTITYAQVSANGFRILQGLLVRQKEEKIDKIEPAMRETIARKPDNKDLNIALPAKKTESSKDYSVTNYFGLAQYELTQVMQDSLNKIVDVLENNPALNIIICGHASPDGPENLNMMLSYYRANEAYKWLKKKNVDNNRIFRIYAGEYLLTDTRQARMFSVFTTFETDIPEQTVITPKIKNHSSQKSYELYGSDTENADYLRYVVKNNLPAIDSDLLILPVKDVHIFEKGQTLYSIAKQYNTKHNIVIEANQLDINKIADGDVVFIPR